MLAAYTLIRESEPNIGTGIFIPVTNAIESLNRKNTRIVPDRRGRNETDLSGDPQLRERRQKCQRMVCRAQPVRYHVRGTL
jgi:hypothetical protein